MSWLKHSKQNKHRCKVKNCDSYKLPSWPNLMLSVTISNCSQYLDLAIRIYINNIINERPSYRLIMHILLGRGWVVAWVCLFYRDWLIYIRLSNTLITNTVHLQKYSFQRYISSLEILHCLFWVICLSLGHLDYPITASETNTLQ